MAENRYRAVVVGVSAGGLKALSHLLPSLEHQFPLPILIVQHLSKHSDPQLVSYLQNYCILPVKWAEDKECIQPSTVYLAPPDYHLLVEDDYSLALSLESRVNYSRPSIDVFFESAAEAFSDSLLALVMTGANSDGTKGLSRIKQFGGTAVVQAPESAEVDIMPRAAIEGVAVDFIVPLEKLGAFLNTMVMG